ncbi:glycoside hydrolase family 104 protein [Fulvivirga maritima]|uniref:glycoside hydrolase family 24 protein n=1 Tax=Fulvivirga maritima TaxID=2904247 RepID=UPI001F30FCC5|nr:glycoside hydrolase family 104 protein [Fulvivirga maritima]UII28980.1 glycoside hydrolase family 104 protein [Fulvivirga maritima]
MIAQEDEDGEWDLESLKEQKLNSIKDQVGKLMFWKEAAGLTYYPPMDLPTPEKIKPKGIKELGFGTDDPEILAAATRRIETNLGFPNFTPKPTTATTKPVETDATTQTTTTNTETVTEPELSEEKEAPETQEQSQEEKQQEVKPPERTFPSTDQVWHFHPIAFVEHMKRIYGGGKAKSNSEAMIRAFLRLIKEFEGVPGEKGYTTLFGGTQFDDTTTHPEKPVYWYTNKNGDKIHSTAAGAYQIMKTTWWDYNGEVVENGKKTGKKNENRNFVKKYGIKDFSPKSQDEFCIALLLHQPKSAKLLGYLLNGFVTRAIEECAAYTWASFTPGRFKNQGPAKNAKNKKERKELIHNARIKQWESYNKYLADELSGNSDLHLEQGFLKRFGIKEPEPKELIENKKEGLDLNKVIERLNKRAGAIDVAVGYCAKYVRLALEAGGMSTAGRPLSAKDYGPFLLKKGFVEVPIGDDKIGDIVVMESFKNNPDGHIQMYNGENWVSDFVQRTFYPGESYRNAQPKYKIYRWE